MKPSIYLPGNSPVTVNRCVRSAMKSRIQPVVRISALFFVACSTDVHVTLLSKSLLESKRMASMLSMLS